MFRRSSTHPIIILIIGLAGFGLLYRLVKNPLGLISEIFIAAAIVGVIYMIYKFLMKKRFGGGLGPSNSKYRKAAQQSKKRYRETSNQLTKVRSLSQKALTSKKTIHSHQANKRKDHNLTVIEGKKNKKKNRAFF